MDERPGVAPSVLVWLAVAALVLVLVIVVVLR